VKEQKMSSEEVNGGGSFLSRNIGGIILAVILTVIYCVVVAAPAELPAIRKIIGFILSIPLSFLGYVIGNKLRLLLHPDFVIASGFWGLLKEKISDDIEQSRPYISSPQVWLKNAPESSGSTWIGTVTYVDGDFQQERDIVANYDSKKKAVTWWFMDSPNEKSNIKPFK
jgi:heme/copper-type cytochrome/quinol oxidase subunit 4